MKPEELKLYQKYEHKDESNLEIVYIGKGNNNRYFFIYKNEYFNMNVYYLNDYGLNMEQIIKNLNFETFIDNNGEKRIKGYGCWILLENNLINLKPILKDKLKNIINR